MMARCRPAQAWPLADLLAGFAEVDAPQGAHLGVLALAMDSRRVVPGTLFLACQGAATHGMAFAEQARQRGALAIAAEPAGAWDPGALADAGARLRLPVIPVPGYPLRPAPWRTASTASPAPTSRCSVSRGFGARPASAISSRRPCRGSFPAA